jgi:hypothetical protein
LRVSAALVHILEQVAAGEMTVEEALEALPLLQVAAVGEFARLDPGRSLRKGVPEVIYAPSKSQGAFVEIVRRMVKEGVPALASRVEPTQADAAIEGVADLYAAGLVKSVAYDEVAGVLEILPASYELPVGNGTIGLLTAGTADVPVAEQAALIAAHMGCRVLRGYDVGVAGVHRLFEPLTHMLEQKAAVLIVVAGMEGALPSVVAGLVDVPVIGVPTSTGYGLGGDGTAALYSILQSCSPGLVAVNIDNGVGAGAAAALIARRATSAKATGG